MGHMAHHAIIVTSWQDEAIQEAHAAAVRIFDDGPLVGGRPMREHWSDLVTPIAEGVTNGYRSFAVLPDGSKEWWPESDEGNSRRNQLTTHLQDMWGHDLFCDWVEVIFGGDEEEARVTGHVHAYLTEEEAVEVP